MKIYLEIEKYQKEDSRIRLIRNKKEKGLLYTSCIGIESAKGEYLIELDQDDFYVDEHLFDILYKIDKIYYFHLFAYNKMILHHFY